MRLHQDEVILYKQNKYSFAKKKKEKKIFEE